MSKEIVWSQGMLLTPQHFQQQNQYIDQKIKNILKCTHNYFWGFEQLKINTEYLTIGKFYIDHCSGVFPDGSFFNIASTDYLLHPLDIIQNEAGSIVYLCISLLVSFRQHCVTP